VDVLRHFTGLKARLMPYLYASAERSAAEGLPLMRAMVLEFPDDPACTHLDRQYLLGDDLLVAPVFTEDGEVTYYVPAGTWTHVLTGERVQGPGWVSEKHGFDSLPLLARPDSVIPFGAVSRKPDYDYADGVTLRIYELADGTHVTRRLVGPDGATAAVFTVAREAGRITVEALEAPSGWRVQLCGVAEAEAEGARTSPDPLGLIAEPAGQVVTLYPVSSQPTKSAQESGRE
jgi:alpha-D-xyloside xylohydrolase